MGCPKFKVNDLFYYIGDGPKTLYRIDSIKDSWVGYTGEGVVSSISIAQFTAFVEQKLWIVIPTEGRYLKNKVPNIVGKYKL